MNEEKENPKDSSANDTDNESESVEIEDAFEAEQHDAEEPIPGETPQDFDPGARAFTEDEPVVPDVSETPPAQAVDQSVRRRPASSDDDMGDADAFSATEEAGDQKSTQDEINWDRELSTQRIALELRRIEADVRKLLEDKDPKRKRRLAGTRRWLELEEDILALTHTGRIDESTLLELQNLVIRRHYLFHRLRFLASTRPTWNS